MVFNGGIGKEAQMSGRDLLLVAGTAAISSLLTYFIGAAITTPTEVLHYERSAAGEDRAAALSTLGDETPRARAGNQELYAANAPLLDAAQRDGAVHTSTKTAQEPAFAVQKRHELGERISSLYSDGSNPSAVSAKIENRFYSEEWNQEWAGSKERSIRTLIDTSKDLSGLTPLQVTCRSKNCQVVFSASNQDQVRRVSEKFMQVATRGDVDMNDKVISFFPDTSMGRVVFYLSENGNMDLFE
jgi:hypothetical protein